MSENSILTYCGETLTVAEWARKTGLKDKTIYMRIRNGWTIEKTLGKPLHQCLLLKRKEKMGWKAEAERTLERKQIKEWLRTPSAEVDERREEGDIL